MREQVHANLEITMSRLWGHLFASITGQSAGALLCPWLLTHFWCMSKICSDHFHTDQARVESSLLTDSGRPQINQTVKPCASIWTLRTMNCSYLRESWKTWETPMCAQDIGDTLLSHHICPDSESWFVAISCSYAPATSMLRRLLCHLHITTCPRRVGSMNGVPLIKTSVSIWFQQRRYAMGCLIEPKPKIWNPGMCQLYFCWVRHCTTYPQIYLCNLGRKWSHFWLNVIVSSRLAIMNGGCQPQLRKADSNIGTCRVVWFSCLSFEHCHPTIFELYAPQHIAAGLGYHPIKQISMSVSSKAMTANTPDLPISSTVDLCAGWRIHIPRNASPGDNQHELWQHTNATATLLTTSSAWPRSFANF